MEANRRRTEVVLLIFDELRREPLIEGYDVNVSAEGSDLVLRGRLPSEAAHRRVLEIARARVGSLTLRDSLVMAGSGRAGSPPVEGR